MINILAKEFDFEIANLYYKKIPNCNYMWLEEFDVSYVSVEVWIHMFSVFVICLQTYDSYVTISYVWDSHVRGISSWFSKTYDSYVSPISHVWDSYVFSLSYVYKHVNLTITICLRFSKTYDSYVSPL